MVDGPVRKGEYAVIPLAKSLGSLEKHELSTNRIAVFAPVPAGQTTKYLLCAAHALIHIIRILYIYMHICILACVVIAYVGICMCAYVLS